MSYTNIWIHFVWSTKRRAPILTRDLRAKLFFHIRGQAAAKKILLDSIGGHVDHVHALVKMKSSQSPAFVMQNIKGESAHWVNKENLTLGAFEWQDDYFAMTVSQSHVAAVRNYILRQEEHHRVKTFQEEYESIFEQAFFTPT